MEEQGGGENKRGKGEQEEFFSGMAEARQKRRKKCLGPPGKKPAENMGGETGS